MGRRGCVDLPSLPLQVLLRDNPGWKAAPVAVTREEKPQSPILFLNRAARQSGLAAGMKYASALAIVPGLRAREVPPARVEEVRGLVVRLLSSFTPDIEPCPFDADALWVSLEGLRSLFSSEASWVEQVRSALAAEGFHARIAAGFTRFGTYTIARSRSRPRVFESREEERALMGRSSIDVLPLPVRVRATLRKLEVRTVREFAALPAGETARRFGREAGLVQQAILSDDPLPIQPVFVEEETAVTRRLDAPPRDLDLLMPHVEELLAAEAGQVERERSVIAGITLVLRTEEGEVIAEVIRPAAPTLRLPVLLRLVRLRLSARQLRSGVQDLELRAARARPSRRQEELFAVRGRDLEAGARAFAAIRARFGNASVTAARLVDSHLPEQSFRWVNVRAPVLPRPRQAEGEGAAPAAGDGGNPVAVRRILLEPMPGQVREGRDLAGPFLVSGGWWNEDPQQAFSREYRFTDSPQGILWRYRDLRTGVDWIQGVVD